MRRHRQIGLVVTLLLVSCTFQRSGAQDNLPADDLSVKERKLFSELAAAEMARWTFTANSRTLNLSAEPMMRWSYFDIGRYYGDLHVVTDQERPVALFATFRWFHPVVRSYICATSLDSSRFVASRNGAVSWKPATSALQWKPLPDSGRPGASSPNRLVQMRRFARRFSGEVSDLRVADRSSMKKLRLLPQPIYRYSTDAVDGALFAFSNGTNPAVLLCLEADLNPENPRWQYGFARRWSFESRMSDENEEIWMAPSVQMPMDRNSPYYLEVIPEN